MFGKRIQLIKVLKLAHVSFVVATVWFYYMLINHGRSGHLCI
jgi:hypothetical protein